MNAQQIANDIQDQPEDENEMETQPEGTDASENPNQSDADQDLVAIVQARIKEAMPTIEQLGQFEQMFQQAPELAQLVAKICPEMIMAFVNVAQEVQSGQQTGMNPPGGADGALVPPVQEPEEEEGMPQPAATTNGNMPPSMPTSASPLRKQFYNGQ